MQPRKSPFRPIWELHLKKTPFRVTSPVLKIRRPYCPCGNKGCKAHHDALRYAHLEEQLNEHSWVKVGGEEVHKPCHCAACKQWERRKDALKRGDPPTRKLRRPRSNKGDK